MLELLKKKLDFTLKELNNNVLENLKETWLKLEIKC